MRITELGTSQRDAWARCPALHYHQYMMGTRGWGITPYAEPLALLFGQTGHVGLETWYTSIRAGVDPLAAVAASVTAMREKVTAIQKQWAERGDGESAPTLIDGDEGDLIIAEAFMAGYANYFKDDAKFRIVAVEWSFNIDAASFYEPALGLVKPPLPLSEMPPTRGTIDLVIETDKGFVLVDHKFHKSIVTDLETGSSFWPQAITYSRAVELTFGPVAGFVYNQIRKPSGLKPKTIGGELESQDAFLERLRAEYILYPDYFERYNGGRKRGYFLRSPVLPVSTAPKRFLAECLYRDGLMCATYALLPDRVDFNAPPPTIPRNHAECSRWGRACPYVNLCTWGYNPATLREFAEREEAHK